jgi:hypothetical protein
MSADPAATSGAPAAPARGTAAQEVIARFTARWNDSESVEESTLLRLAILRDLMREFHAQRSVLLASGKRAEAQGFREWEARAEAFRSAASLEGPLEELLHSGQPARKRTRLLPEALFSILEKDKFERYDRQWESTIAAEAASLGWRFWHLNAWVQISAVETWHRALSEKLNPHGIVLFAESAADTAGSDPNLWHGQWLVVLKPRYLTPDFHVRALPGSSETPAPPQWKLVFSPKKR